MISRDELPLLIRARDRWASLEDELDAKMEYRAGGQIRFVRNTAELEIARGWVDHERTFGLESEILDRHAVNQIVPMLRGPIVAASWSPRDATVNPFLACRALVAGAQRHGCQIFPGTPVTAICAEKGAVRSVVARADRFETGVAINASGPWAARVAELAGVKVPIVPRKAQCLATVAMPPTIPCVVGACESAGGVEAGYTQIQQTAHGQVLFNTVVSGGIRPDALQDHDREVEKRFVHDSVETLLWLFPDLASAALLRSWCAYEAVTPDDHFLIGPIGDVAGLLIAAGDGGTGFNRAPLIGELVAQHVTGEPLAMPLAPYAPGRFAVAAQGH
jgi:sarcosine oxidase subunit beta